MLHVLENKETQAVLETPPLTSALWPSLLDRGGFAQTEVTRPSGFQSIQISVDGEPAGGVMISFVNSSDEELFCAVRNKVTPRGRNYPQIVRKGKLGINQPKSPVIVMGVCIGASLQSPYIPHTTRLDVAHFWLSRLIRGSSWLITSLHFMSAVKIIDSPKTRGPVAVHFHIKAPTRSSVKRRRDPLWKRTFERGLLEALGPLCRNVKLALVLVRPGWDAERDAWKEEGRRRIFPSSQPPILTAISVKPNHCSAGLTSHCVLRVGGFLHQRRYEIWLCQKLKIRIHLICLPLPSAHSVQLMWNTEEGVWAAHVFFHCCSNLFWKHGNPISMFGPHLSKQRKSAVLQLIVYNNLQHILAF